ncbi:MAG TPA: glycoside hydrolase family 3 N-terminal domain-containing protein [Polyangiaceae bacterium]|nr:glycoside hydrolase family 3 N-terminal domain-containing protein [Polyangiaceae bacterium]
MTHSVSSARVALSTACLVAAVASCSGRSLHNGDSSRNAAAGNSSTSFAGSPGVATAGSGGSIGGGDDGQILPTFACSAVASQQFDAAHMRAYSVSAEIRASANAVLSAMGPSERASQMTGIPIGAMDYTDVDRSLDVEVPGIGTIRGYWYRDAGRGVNLDAGQPNREADGDAFSTVFPAPSVRAASWDLDLEKRVGEAVGDEAAASLNNVLLAPAMNIVRHPYWGRAQETYGEDMYHLGRMASAFTVGVQEYVLACAKHFAANNIEKWRSSQNALMNEQTLREIYGRHFEMVVQDAGVGCVMASYNKINGVKSTQNKHLLREILKAPVEQGGFGFQGLVISDWWAMPGDQNVPFGDTPQTLTSEAVRAGLDIEVPWTLHYSAETLAQADPMLVEEAAQRVLTQKFRFNTALATDPWGRRAPTSTLSHGSIASNAAHEALAEEAELKSAVLLTNGTSSAPVLPLVDATHVAVLGLDRDFELVSSSVPKSCSSMPWRSCTFHFATDPALGDRGSSRVNGDPARAVGPFAGIQQAAGSMREVTSGNSVAAAAGAEAIVVIVGYTPGDEGEEFAIASGGDRSSLNLPAGQNEFVTSVLDLMKPTVIIVESGSIVNLPWLSHPNRGQATIWAGYSGLRGGAALGKLIFGLANFSGKMPLAWPTQAELDRAPFTDSQLETTMGYFFGYREYDRRKAAGQKPDLIFPFGHGASYSSFEYSNLNVPCQTVTKDAVVSVTVDVQNSSAVDGDEIAMLFVKPPPKPASVTGDRPVKELKSFARVSVKAGQTVKAVLPVRIRDLRRWEGGENGNWLIDSGEYSLLVGKNAEDAETSATHATLTVEGG